MTADASAKTPAKKKRSILKWLLYTGAGIVVLLIVAFMLYYFMIDGYIRSTVIEAGKNATGQVTKLDLADLRAFSGKLTLSKFNLGNPKDYDPAGVCDFSSCAVEVDTGSLMSDTVVVKEIVISDLVVSIEQKDFTKNNLMEIINYIQGQRGQETAGTQAAPQTDAKPSAGKSKEMTINVVRIVRPTLNFNLLGQKSSFKLEDIVFEKPLNPDGRNMKLVDLIGKILLQMAQQAFSNPKIPLDIQKHMNDSLGKLRHIINKDSIKDLVKIGEFVKLPNVDMDKLQADIQKNLQNLKIPGDIKIPGGGDIKIPGLDFGKDPNKK